MLCCVPSFSSFQQCIIVRSEKEARARRIDLFQVLAVPLGARRAAFALFVEPGELILERNDKPAFEQKHIRQRERFNAQLKVALDHKRPRSPLATTRLVAAALIASRLRQVEHAHAPRPRRRLAVLHSTHRHHMMLVGHYTLHRVLGRNFKAERFAQRVQVIRLYASFLIWIVRTSQMLPQAEHELAIAA